MNKPKIRFNEFENIWTKSKLGEIYEVYSGNTPSRSDDRNYQNGEIPWIKTTDLNNTVICSNEEKISVYGATKLKVLPEKSVLIAMYGGFNQIGRTGLLAYPATINQALAALMPVNEINPNFLLNFLNFKKESWRNVAASSRKDPNITKNDVEKFKISFPSLDEQSAIGCLFRTLDDLLASYKDNLANYQSLKATMLSKMFPKAGQTVPEIRLDGFEGEWGKYYLGDIFEQVSNYIEPSAENELWSLTVEKGLTPKTDRYKRDFLVKKNDKFKKVDVNEFVYNPMNLTLGALDLNDNEVTISVSGYYVVMKNRDIEKFDNDFLKILLKTTYAIYQYKQFATGTLIEKQRVQFPTFSEIPFYLPPIAEQQAIGSYFSNLDNLIGAYQEKISQLETLKKKLLQDMFI